MDRVESSIKHMRESLHHPTTRIPSWQDIIYKGNHSQETDSHTLISSQLLEPNTVVAALNGGCSYAIMGLNGQRQGFASLGSAELNDKEGESDSTRHDKKLTVTH